MNLIKGVILFFIISLCLILQCEVYQNELWNFERAEYVVSKYEVSDEEMEDFLTEFARVADENSVSLFSGITTVEFHDFYELADTSDYSDGLISYIGNADDIESVYEILSEKYSLTYPAYWETSENDLVAILWSIVAFLLIIINCVESHSKKKGSCDSSVIW